MIGNWGGAFDRPTLMESRSEARGPAWPTPVIPCYYFRPVDVSQTVWPSLPLTPYHVTAPTLSHVSRNYPHHDGAAVIHRHSRKESRKFYLYRSVFDLVQTHPYLALTDPSLLGWYLHLSPEDTEIIQDEGGFQQFLQRHPALELSAHHVSVKSQVECAGPAQAAVQAPQHAHVSRMLGAKKCNCEIHHHHLRSEMLPDNVRDALTVVGWSNGGNGSSKHLHEEADHLQGDFQTAFSCRITQDPSRQKAHKVKEQPSWPVESSGGVSADLEPDGCRWEGRPELRSQIPAAPGQRANLTYTQVGPTQSEWPAAERGSPSVDAAADEASSGLYSIMEDDGSILACRPSEKAEAHSSWAPLGLITPNSDAAAVGSETVMSNQPITTSTATERSTSPLPRPPTCDMMVGTELPLHMSVLTQTERPGAADKHVLTDLHMSDLDYLAKKFMKLKMLNEEPSEHEQKLKSLEAEVRKECGRAQQAELRLLALSYSMCKQRCLRLCCPSEGGPPTPLPKTAENVQSLLQQLQCEYEKLQDQILAGVPLQQLKPLSVGSEASPGGTYSPALTIADLLVRAPSSSEEPHYASHGEKTRPDDSSSKCQHSPGQEGKTRISRRAVTSVPQDRDGIHNVSQQDGQRSACKEADTTEAWYDAEEDLEPPGPASAAARNPPLARGDGTTEPSSEEAQSSTLCVSNLPDDVTEREVRLWFEKYHISEVSISAATSDLRVAIVTISGAQSARGAVRELNGCNMQGTTLHVEHINGATDGGVSQASASISGPESPKGTAQSADASQTGTSSPEGGLLTGPPWGSSIRTRKVVCVSPTAKGTLVPQHFGTMGSFDALTAELAQRHPDVGRQRIMDALVELRAEHQGALCGLPLRTVIESTADLLSKPASATPI